MLYDAVQCGSQSTRLLWERAKRRMMEEVLIVGWLAVVTIQSSTFLPFPSDKMSVPYLLCCMPGRAGGRANAASYDTSSFLVLRPEVVFPRSFVERNRSPAPSSPQRPPVLFARCVPTAWPGLVGGRTGQGLAPVQCWYISSGRGRNRPTVGDSAQTSSAAPSPITARWRPCRRRYPVGGVHHRGSRLSQSGRRSYQTHGLTDIVEQ